MNSDAVENSEEVVEMLQALTFLTEPRVGARGGYAFPNAYRMTKNNYVGAGERRACQRRTAPI